MGRAGQADWSIRDQCTALTSLHSTTQSNALPYLQGSESRTDRAAIKFSRVDLSGLQVQSTPGWPLEGWLRAGSGLKIKLIFLFQSVAVRKLHMQRVGPSETHQPGKGEVIGLAWNGTDAYPVKSRRLVPRTPLSSETPE